MEWLETRNTTHFSGARHTSGSKAVPNLSADILGDWREEVILCDAEDPSKLHIYTTTILPNIAYIH